MNFLKSSYILKYFVIELAYMLLEAKVNYLVFFQSRQYFKVGTSISEINFYRVLTHGRCDKPHKPMEIKHQASAKQAYKHQITRSYHMEYKIS
jgi:hypothetical protein